VRGADSEGVIFPPRFNIAVDEPAQHSLAAAISALLPGLEGGLGRGLKISPATPVGLKQDLNSGLIFPDTSLTYSFLSAVHILV